MNNKQIEKLLNGLNQPLPRHWKLVETHISYVLLGKTIAYKFKKNIKYSFLNFSTLKMRKHYCERELILNNRISQGVYLKVVPLVQQGGNLIIDGKEGKIIDYALKMKRLKDEKQMHLMLDKNTVTTKHIKALAILLRGFHKSAVVINNKFNLQLLASNFNDIVSVKAFIKKAMGPMQAAIIKKSVKASDQFLKVNHDILKQRAANGFVKDCHGDLHSRNIFLYSRPIIFDCIEFNDAFRQIDVLDELAFFCMDLEVEGFHQLSKAFIKYYFRQTKTQFGKPEQMLFTYYKSYRANVRAKVNALRAIQATGAGRKKNLAEVNKYLRLMEQYSRELN